MLGRVNRKVSPPFLFLLYLNTGGGATDLFRNLKGY